MTGDNMTKKDYELIAKVLKDAQATYEDIYSDDTPRRTASLTALGHVVSRLTEELAIDNPRFTPRLFAQACGQFTDCYGENY